MTEMLPTADNKIKEAANLILYSDRITCFTGAGACTDSGIPDYRGIGSSYWMKYNSKDFTYQQFLSNEESRKNYWLMDQEFYELVKIAQPNKIHYAIAQLEGMGKIEGIITQNVDALHQKAGSSPDKVIEIHGSIFTVSCLQCFKKYSRQDIYERIRTGVLMPHCNFCGGILKTDTISFGQPIPQQLSAKALMAALNCNLFIVIGSSLLVQPASYLVVKAKEAGAKIIIINLTSTPYDSYADLIFYENASKVISDIMEMILLKRS